MTRTRKLMGIAAVAFIVACTAVAVQVERSHASVTEVKVAGGCAEGTFEWRWNLPGSACEAKAN
jgi:hypothetical protein